MPSLRRYASVPVVMTAMSGPARGCGPVSDPLRQSRSGRTTSPGEIALPVLVQAERDAALMLLDGRPPMTIVAIVICRPSPDARQGSTDHLVDELLS